MRAGTISRPRMTCIAMPVGALASMGAVPAGGAIALPFDFSKLAIDVDVTVKGMRE